MHPIGFAMLWRCCNVWLLMPIHDSHSWRPTCKMEFFSAFSSLSKIGQNLTDFCLRCTGSPLYLYPFLNTQSKSRPFEYLRLTSLGVIGALVKVDDTEVISFLLSTEIIPLCLRIMETGSELSKTVATFIVQKVLLEDGKHMPVTSCCNLGSALTQFFIHLVLLLKTSGTKLRLCHSRTLLCSGHSTLQYGTTPAGPPIGSPVETCRALLLAIGRPSPSS